MYFWFSSGKLIEAKRRQDVTFSLFFCHFVLHYAKLLQKTELRKEKFKEVLRNAK